MVTKRLKRNLVDKSKIKDIYHILRTSIKNVMFFFLFLFIVIILLLLFSVVELSHNKDSGNISTPLFSAYIIATESMVPTINVNDGIIVKRVKDYNIEVGDVITFLSSNDLTITHRVIDKEYNENGEYEYRTKGDNNFLVDAGVVSFGDIYGKVLFRIPKIGYIHKFVSSPLGFVVSILVPIIVVILYEIGRVWHVIRKRNKELSIL